MNDNKAIEKKLHNLIIKRQTLINEKKELLRQISFTKARLLLPENQNSFYKHELSTYEKKLNIVIMCYMVLCVFLCFCSLQYF